MDRRQRDEWWIHHVYQGSVVQLTGRAIAVGFLLGGLLSLTNLYVSAKVGATFGMGLTASILAYTVFAGVERSTSVRGLHVLENNMIQTVAGAAGYMASAFTASLAAYVVLQQDVLPWWQATAWVTTLSLLGMVFAIPLKQQFVNHLEFPFPEGQACAVVLAALHQTALVTPPSAINAASRGTEQGTPPDPTHAMGRPARTLAVSCLLAGTLKLLQSPTLLERFRMGAWHIPEMLDDWYYRLADRWHWWVPRLQGVPLRELTIRPTFEVAMMAVGGLMGIRVASSLFLGAVLNYAVLVPWMIQRGAILTTPGPDGTQLVGFRAISAWSLWCGVAMMTSSSLTMLLLRLRGIPAAMRSLSTLAQRGPLRPMAKIELPIGLFWGGLVVVGGALVWMSSAFFGVAPALTVGFLPLVFLLTVLGVHTTALTSITPTGSMARVAQLAAGVLAPHQVTPNIALGAITADTTMHASAFCQHLRPGYLLGGNPRCQAIGQVIGAVAGVVFCVPAFYGLLLRNDPAHLISDAYPFPAATVWIGVAKMLSSGPQNIPSSAVVAAILAGGLGFLLSLPIARWRALPLPIGVGLAFLIPFHISLSIFVGAFLFWMCERSATARSGRFACRVTSNREAICAGLMTGSALVGVLVLASDVLWP